MLQSPLQWHDSAAIKQIDPLTVRFPPTNQKYKLSCCRIQINLGSAENWTTGLPNLMSEIKILQLSQCQLLLYLPTFATKCVDVKVSGTVTHKDCSSV